MDKVEMNKVIAMFMGAKKSGSSTGIENGIATEYKGKTGNIEFKFYDKEGAWTDFQRMEFHESYDWLMPVWAKFRDLNIKTSELDYEIHRAFRNKIDYAICYKPIIESHKLLFEAIQWYNSINNINKEK